MSPWRVRFTNGATNHHRVRFYTAQYALLTRFVHSCTLNAMKLSISETRRRLPELVRHVRRDTGAKVEITVRDEVVAELRAALPEPEPGAAARKLLEVMRRLPKRRRGKTDVSTRVNEYLYGLGGEKRERGPRPA